MDYKDDVVKSNIIIYTTEDGLSRIETTKAWYTVQNLGNKYFERVYAQRLCTG